MVEILASLNMLNVLSAFPFANTRKRTRNRCSTVSTAENPNSLYISIESFVVIIVCPTVWRLRPWSCLSNEQNICAIVYFFEKEYTRVSVCVLVCVFILFLFFLCLLARFHFQIVFFRVAACILWGKKKEKKISVTWENIDCERTIIAVYRIGIDRYRDHPWFIVILFNACILVDDSFIVIEGRLRQCHPINIIERSRK